MTLFSIQPPLSSDGRNRWRIGRQRFRRRHRLRCRRHGRWCWLIWHWRSPFNESFSLQRLAVNLINANEATDEIPIFLICESTVAGGPGELTRRFRMIGVVNEITVNSIILRGRFSFVDQHRVIDAETRVSCEKTNKQLAARQSCIEIGVGFFVVTRVVLEKHPEISEPKISRPAKANICSHNFAARLAHCAQVGVAREDDALICRQWLSPNCPTGDITNASGQRPVVQWRGMRIEASELLKLHRRTAQDKTSASVPFRFSFLSLPQIGMNFEIFEDGCVSETDRIAVETKIRCC